MTLTRGVENLTIAKQEFYPECSFDSTLFTADEILKLPNPEDRYRVIRNQLFLLEINRGLTTPIVKGIDCEAENPLPISSIEQLNFGIQCTHIELERTGKLSSWFAYIPIVTINGETIDYDTSFITKISIEELTEALLSLTLNIDDINALNPQLFQKIMVTELIPGFNNLKKLVRQRHAIAKK